MSKWNIRGWTQDDDGDITSPNGYVCYEGSAQMDLYQIAQRGLDLLEDALEGVPEFETSISGQHCRKRIRDLLNECQATEDTVQEQIDRVEDKLVFRRIERKVDILAAEIQKMKDKQ